MATQWSSTHSGTADADDSATAIAEIDAENAKRTAQNAILAAQVPPGTPIALLPKANASQINASIDVIMAKETNDLWIGKKQRLQQSQEDFTPEELSEMRANVSRRRRAGEAKASIIADTAA